MEQNQKKDIMQEAENESPDTKELEKVVIKYSPYVFLILVNAILNALAKSIDNSNK